MVPGARVVYVDHDPMVLAYASELLTSDGTTVLVQADLRDPDSVLHEPDLRALIDFGEPAGLLMTAVMQFVADSSDPWGLVARYVGALAPDSYLALSHITADALPPPRAVQTGVDIYAKSAEAAYPRPRAAVERFFDGLEIVAPYDGAGRVVTHIGLWGAEDSAAADSDGSRASIAAWRGAPRTRSRTDRGLSWQLNRRSRRWVSMSTRRPGSDPATATGPSRSPSSATPPGPEATGC